MQRGIIGKSSNQGGVYPFDSFRSSCY